VRSWVPELDVIPILAVVNDAAAITPAFLEPMPSEYVVKGAHGSHMLMLVRKGTVRNANCAKGASTCVESRRSQHAAFISATCAKWLSVDYGKKFHESGYSYVRPSCVFERSLLDRAGEVPRDVKVFVVHGKPLFILDVSSRYSIGSSSSNAKHVLVDVKGRALPAAFGANPLSRKAYLAACAARLSGNRKASPVPVYAPGELEKILRNAKELAAHVSEWVGSKKALPQVRIDFFVSRQRLYFSEITFWHQACNFALWDPLPFDYLFGHMISTPQTRITPLCLADVMPTTCSLGTMPSFASKTTAPSKPAVTTARKPQTRVHILRPSSNLRGCRRRVAIVTSNFGGYDVPYLDTLPACMAGFVYTDKPDLRLKSPRWGTRVLRLPGTAKVSAPRLSTKYAKFAAYRELQNSTFDAVLYRDMNVRLQNMSAVFALLRMMENHQIDLLLRDWHFPQAAKGEKRLWWEMNDMLTRRKAFVARSRDNVLKWRDFLQSLGRTFPEYAEGNLFMYLPSSPVVARIFEKIFEKCHEIERDQFIIPYAIDNETRVRVNMWLPHHLKAVKVEHVKQHSSAN